MTFCPDSWALATCSESDSPGDSPGDGSTCTALTSLSPDHQDIVILAAKEFLWNATNQRFGLCPVTIRPCSEGCYRESTYIGWSGIPMGFGLGLGNGWVPYIFNGNWFNLICGDCGTKCTHQNLSKVKLPGVVNSVTEVRLDGAVFTDWEYNVNYGLVRTDGGHWPKDQDITAPLTEANTFGVTFLQGLPVPAGGQLAAGALACEFAKAFCNDNSCQLPQRVRTITREGVTIALQDNFSMLFGALGPMTGIWAIDQWIASVNFSAKRRSRVLTPNAAPTWKQ